MTRHNLAAGLYAPLRLLLYENDYAKTCFEYDRPSSLLGQFNDQRIAAVGASSDQKMEKLVAQAVA